MTDVIADGSDLTPKKFHMNGYVQYGSKITFCVNVYQELATVNTAALVSEVVTRFFHLGDLHRDLENMIQLWRANGKLTCIKMPGLEMTSNGSRYPSCSIYFSVDNPQWDANLLYTQQPSWWVSFCYKKGKWDNGMHTYGQRNTVVTEQQMIHDRIVALRDEL